MHNRAANQYRRVFLESAPPATILGELYRRLLADCALARERIAARDYAGKGGAISHALAIVEVLEGALDRDAAPELTAQLARLYDFVRGRLMRANAGMDTSALDEAERIVTKLCDGFREAAEQAP